MSSIRVSDDRVIVKHEWTNKTTAGLVGTITTDNWHEAVVLAASKCATIARHLQMEDAEIQRRVEEVLFREFGDEALALSPQDRVACLI